MLLIKTRRIPYVLFYYKHISLKREILNFSNKLSVGLSKPNKKFFTDITYGMLASGSCILTDIVDQLHEDTKKINTIERISRHLTKGVLDKTLDSYLSTVSKWSHKQPFIYIDDSDVIKPNGFKFEAFSTVRDGSKSTSKKSIYQKGYQVTEACFLTKNNHPVSLFSTVYSSNEKNFISTNDVTFSAIERSCALFNHATFVMDRGYDDNKIFLKLDELKQDYIIRLTTKRKLRFHNKWVLATQLRNQRKEKIRTYFYYRNKKQEAYLSHVKVQITASRKTIYLVLVYGIAKHPMMLATNKPIRSKEDVLTVAKLYFTRWNIEKYLRCKKQVFKFESFRVRKLKAINALNFYITVCMAFLAHISMKTETNALKVSITRKTQALKEKVKFFFYQISKVIKRILGYSRIGIRAQFNKQYKLII